MLETNYHTPYYLSLHYRDVAHTMILGRTGAGKSFLLNFLITNLQKYDPRTSSSIWAETQNLTQAFSAALMFASESNPKNSRLIRFHSRPPRRISTSWLSF